MIYIEPIIVSILFTICIIVLIGLVVAISLTICKIQFKRYDKVVALQKEKYPDLYETYDELNKYIHLHGECHNTVSQLKETIDNILDNEKYYDKEDYWTDEKIIKLANARTQYKENEEKLKKYNQECKRLRKQFEELKEKYNIKYL